MSDALTNPENVTASGGHRDAITATASPRPWRVEVNRFGQSHVLAADDTHVDGPVGPDTDIGAANAALIVDAVNEREAVRDALRDMEADAEAAWEGTPLRRVLVKHVTALREALAAIGEDKQ